MKRLRKTLLPVSLRRAGPSCDRDPAEESSPDVSRRLSRQEILAHRIIDLLQSRPGFLQRDLFRELGEKDILVLSLIDEMIRGGIIRREGEPARLYLPAEIPSPAREELPTETVQPPPRSDHGDSDHRPETVLALISLYRFCTETLGVEVEVGSTLRARRDSVILLEGWPGPGGLNIRLAPAISSSLASQPEALPERPTSHTAQDGSLTLFSLGLSELEALLANLATPERV